MAWTLAATPEEFTMAMDGPISPEPPRKVQPRNVAFPAKAVAAVTLSTLTDVIVDELDLSNTQPTKQTIASAAILTIAGAPRSPASVNMTPRTVALLLNTHGLSNTEAAPEAAM